MSHSAIKNPMSQSCCRIRSTKLSEAGAETAIGCQLEVSAVSSIAWTACDVSVDRVANINFRLQPPYNNQASVSAGKGLSRLKSIALHSFPGKLPRQLNLVLREKTFQSEQA